MKKEVKHDEPLDWVKRSTLFVGFKTCGEFLWGVFDFLERVISSSLFSGRTPKAHEDVKKETRCL